MRCGLLGEHLSHSYSPQIHGFLGDYSYDLFEVAPQDLDTFLQTAPFDGLNVTIPYKKAVLPYCTRLSDAAKATGSVNTLVRQPDGTLFGHNTDCAGFLWLLQRNGGIHPGEKALILGTGGAAGTAAGVLSELGAEVIMISRKGIDNYVNYTKHADAVLLVNATPVGMYPHNGERLVNLATLPNLRCVLDMIYNPAKTALLLDAEALGISFEGGLPMLVGQAKAAAECFTGRVLPDSLCDNILCKLQSQMRNIVLVGMPGCGKSSVGQALAQQLGRPFVDADREIEKHVGPIPAFFAAKGEDAFRSIETRVLAELGKASGTVIATGGGCVTRTENRPLLRQNSLIVWLRRDLSQLPIEGRPLSQRGSLEQMWTQREPLYRNFADCSIDNHGTVEETANKILEVIL